MAHTQPAELRLTHLKQLEAEAVHIIREVVAQCERPVMMYSIGKDASVMLHIDTTWEFRDMFAVRDPTAAELGIELLVPTNPEGPASGINPCEHGSPR